MVGKRGVWMFVLRNYFPLTTASRLDYKKNVKGPHGETREQKLINGICSQCIWGKYENQCH